MQLTAESDGTTWVLAWEDTLYYQQGERLADPEQTDRVRKVFAKCYLERDDRDQLKLYEKLKKQQVRELKKLIIELGGVNDPDFETIPRWAKRRKGHTLDYLLNELAAEGYYYNDSNELYNELWGVTK